MSRKRSRKKRSRSPGSGARAAGTTRADSGSAGSRESAAEPDRKPAGPVPWTVPWLVEWIKTLAFALLIFFFLRTFVVESFVISSGSMERTLLVGDYLLVNKVGLGSNVPLLGWHVPGYAAPRRGDIVVFRARHAPGLDIVKRVVGVPGDTLSMKAGVLYLNGRPRAEPYVVHDADVADEADTSMVWQRQYLAPGADRATYRPTRDTWGPIVVPPERYFMLGDNREHSLDSRFWGFAERSKLKGKPIFRYYSYDKLVLKPFRWITAMRPGRIGPVH
ncbi:MAG: signal peptidase I [Gemmatimonadota bacterium]